jgi:hypothetical protein
VATIVYLDADDEITSAAQRIRAADDRRVGLVLPFGSRVATSRINFRLLAREAQANGRRLDIVAPDASARALAASAGLAVFGSVGEYEAALDADDADDLTIEEGAGAAAAGAAGVVDATVRARPVDPSRDAAPTQPVRPAAPPVAVPVAAQDHASPEGSRSARRRRGVAALLVVVALAIGAGAVAATTILPSATITVTPHIERVGPLAFTVTADPAATTVDPASAVIPATTLEIPVSATGEFKATGKKIVREKARGAVRFTNCDPSAAYNVPAGTIVSTRGGTGFTVRETVFLPVAVISGSPPNIQVKCTSSDVAVTAAEAGEGGNVAAGQIRVVPARYNRNLVRVTNPAATSGGSRQEFPRIKQQDVDAAIAQLKTDTRAELEARLDDPATIPEGATAFPDTATLGTLATDVDPTTLAGQELPTFSLTMTGTGTVQAVDASPIEAIAEERLGEQVADGSTLVPGSVTVDVGVGTVRDGVITFAVQAAARQLRQLDASALRSLVRGRSKADAEAALAPFGDASVVLWPDFVTSVPDNEGRISLTIGDAVDALGPDPTAAPVPSATAQPGGSPSVGSSSSSAEPSPSGFPLVESPGNVDPSQPVPSG